MPRRTSVGFRDFAEPAIVDALEQCGWQVTLVSVTDWPDLHCGKPGRSIWLEVKTGKRQQSQAQREQSDRMRSYGMDVRVVRSVNQALFELEGVTP